jgi:ubiquinone biosynthesis accessory factor UbiJ
MLLEVAVAGLNHLLKQQASWAPAMLVRFAGAQIAVHFSNGATTQTPLPTAQRIVIDPNGYVRALNDSDVLDPLPRLSVHIPFKSDLLPVLMSQGFNGAMRQVRFEGDAELASALGKLAKELSWDAEEDLSQVVGDIAAHRLAGITKQLFGDAKRFSQTAQQQVSKRLTQDQGELISTIEMEQFRADLRQLRDSVDRFEAKLQLSKPKL